MNRYLLIFLLLTGCGKEQITTKGPLIHDREEDTPQRYHKVMDIWKSDDGTYRLETDYRVIGTYTNLEEARRAKTNEAIETWIRVKQQELEIKRREMKRRGTLVE